MTFAISWSRLERFEQCPLKSYWMDFAPKNLKIEQGFSPILEKGKLWHKWMEDALKGRELPPEVSQFKPLVTAIRNSNGGLFVEHKLTFTENYQKCDWFSKKAYWRTIYDAILVGETTYSFDWKSGKVKDKATDQLKFSGAAAMLAWPEIQTIKNHYVWLEHPSVPPTTMEFTRKQLPAVMNEFEERVEMVKMCVEQKAYEPKPSALCRFCPCTKAHCKYAEN